MNHLVFRRILTQHGVLYQDFQMSLGADKRSVFREYTAVCLVIGRYIVLCSYVLLINDGSVEVYATFNVKSVLIAN